MNSSEIMQGADHLTIATWLRFRLASALAHAHGGA